MRTAKKKVTPESQPTYRSGRPVIFKIRWGTRKYVIKRDGFVCQYCSAVLTYKTHTIDHVVPASVGGTEHPDNLVMCCADCNKRASNLQFESFETKKKYLVNLAVEAKKNKEAKFRKAAKNRK